MAGNVVVLMKWSGVMNEKPRTPPEQTSDLIRGYVVHPTQFVALFNRLSAAEAANAALTKERDALKGVLFRCESYLQGNRDGSRFEESDLVGLIKEALYGRS